MFESVKQGERPDGAAYAMSLLLSMVAHALIICALILVPLLWFNALEAGELLTFLIEPPAPPAAPVPPGPPPPAGKAGSPVRNVEDFFPDRIPDGIVPEPPAEEIDSDAVNRMVRGLGSGPAVGGGTGINVGRLITLAPNDPPKPPPPPGKRHEIIRIGTMDPSKLIHQVIPVYPVLAAKAHVSGAVILEAVIDEEGNVTNLKVLKGHPLLVDAAVEAVRQWKYSPTILTGEPIPVQAIVTVVFNLK